MVTPSVERKRDVFWTLHESGCFVIPNPWDAGSAQLLGGMGFKALATTSSGHAWSNAKPDGHMQRDAVLDHIRHMVQATDLPLNADFESGYGKQPSDVFESVQLAVATGVAGLSIEDSSGNPREPVRDFLDAVERVRVAREAIDASGSNTLLVARAENYFVGRPDLPDTIKRLRAYAEVGADCLYAPGIKTRDEIAAVVRAVAPKPVNVLIGWNSDLTVSELSALGVRRVSVGGALARAAWHGFYSAAQALSEGRFDAFANSPTGSELNDLFSAAASTQAR
ncbi:isocitrate lyase/phosphoenolpyruvate mutase family protein [Stutzerimonas zhaodongensis]|uniref:Isocitrate lyase/phosphoenolpyruvate mutase family protein n=1 Tax=Stutzerimonas zhaodongensis TaxID=1176257 RepID=A0A3M2HGU9_9GAMM|nr:isocitrate lyase/phosphoenolpyruvate mutase family protein [Stutzerimonas zhaodongensis]MCQ4317831.1 isocitrate lyase/phosphoenolpyruvate mutase family protein [Stutzerimonas zhaodongensis]RMH87655.1 isocitrate lyase/phosphoenolpyruvate mutase family protein [Stutzerimonas zhaodongensis]